MIMSAGGVWDIQLTANGTRSRLTLNITLLRLQIKEHPGGLCTSSLWLSAEVLVGSTTRKMELSRYEILWSLWPRPTVIKSRTEVFEKFVILWYWHLIPSKMLSYESPVFFSKAVLKEGHLSRRVNFSERYKKVVPFARARTDNSASAHALMSPLDRVAPDSRIGEQKCVCGKRRPG